MNDRMPCFEFDAVSFAWPGGRTVLDRQSFDLPSGVFALIRGASGAGKSTLLRLMNRLEDTQAGEIRYRGRSLKRWEPPLLRREVAYLQQTPVIPDWSVRHILLHSFSFNVNKDKMVPGDQALQTLLDKVKLDDIGLDEAGAALSGGQRQRLSLVRTLITEPRVLLLDEPTASLDSESKACVQQMAQEVCRQGTTVVLITHDGFMPEGVPMVEITVEKGRVEVCS